MQASTPEIAPALRALERRAAAQRVVDAHRMAAMTAIALSEAKADFVATCGEPTTVETSTGDRVEYTAKERRTPDAKRLADQVTATAFALVTEPKVSLKKFDAAVELGTIEADVAADIITVTPYDTVRIIWHD